MGRNSPETETQDDTRRKIHRRSNPAGKFLISKKLLGRLVCAAQEESGA